MVRIARAGDGNLVISRTAPGRGAWLCADPVSGLPREECLEWAVRRRTFTKALREAVSAESVGALRALAPERARMEIHE